MECIFLFKLWKSFAKLSSSKKIKKKRVDSLNEFLNINTNFKKKEKKEGKEGIKVGREEDKCYDLPYVSMIV